MRIILATAMAAGMFCISSCFDQKELELRQGQYLNLVINMSGDSYSTRASGSVSDEGDNVGPEIQRRLNDVYVLIFDADGTKLEYAVQMSRISGEATDEQQTYTAALNVGEKSITTTMWVVANVEQNGFSQADLDEMIGLSKAEVQSKLVFNYYYTQNADGQTLTGWDVSERCLPMWGDAYVSADSSTITIVPGSSDVTVNADLYRAVAKMGFSVNMTEDSSEDTFTLKEVYIYYADTEGAAVPLTDKTTDSSSQYVSPSTTLAPQYTTPSVPTSSKKFGVGNPLKYEVNGGEGISSGDWYNHIFLCESDNTGSDTKVVLVLGGTYAPAGVAASTETSYYRVDLTSGGSDVDIVRNHSYLFNIRSVTNAGTSDPDPESATDGLVVEIEDYVDEIMNGVSSNQYTLSVNQSAFSFSSQGSDLYNLEVSTENVDWEWDNSVYYIVGENTYRVEDNDGTLTIYDEDGNDVTSSFSNAGNYYYYEVNTGDGTTNTILNWLDITAYDSNNETYGQFDVVAEPNVNAVSNARQAYLWLTAGAIRKKVLFMQNAGATANSLLITKAGSYYMSVSYRGNSVTEDEEGDDIDFGVLSTIDVNQIAQVRVIWETADGMITFANGSGALTSSDTEEMAYLKASGCVKYNVNDISLSQFGNWDGSVFDDNHGGNALIGAFDSSGNLLWSWHIWVCTDYADGVRTELWNSGYEFMDRNLGAYTNYPGSGSFGLLYQWGRKDPFIGAYREERQRDYHIVPKQYTRMYTNPATGTLFAWGDYDDSVSGDEATILDYTIENPTTLLDDGLLSSDHNVTGAHGLWGARTFDYTTYDLGQKTMWDPCPDGYRVPTLNALTIDDGANDMWNGGYGQRTARYVPIVSGDSYIGSTQSSDFVSDAPFYGFWLDYAGDAGYADTYSLNTAAAYGVNYYNTSGDPNFEKCGWIDPYSKSNPGKPDNVAWLPLAGIYNGTMDHFGRVGITSDNDLPFSSLQGNGVMWANSPTTNNSTTGGNYPGGLLMHGTEGAFTPHFRILGILGTYSYESGYVDDAGDRHASSLDTDGDGWWASNTGGHAWWVGTSEDGYWTSNRSYFPTTTSGTVDSDYSSMWYDENGRARSGRHFHNFNETDENLLPNPSYAASVRCIVDKDAISSKNNRLYTDAGMTEEVSGTQDIYRYDGSGADFDLNVVVYSVESWQVSNPGAKWLTVTPLSGNSGNETQSSEYLTVKYNTSYTGTAPTVGETAVITITFLHGSTLTLTVRYAGENQ
ncbi:MAG: hypothetical protein LUC24_04875 [Bacteroidales bacterium]|nr:hypothetical protein [Bacteroidales bacterium]